MNPIPFFFALVAFIVFTGCANRDRSTSTNYSSQSTTTDTGYIK